MQVELLSESGHSVQKVDFFQTDTCEVEKLFDSSGAEVFNDRQTLIPLDLGTTTTSEITCNDDPRSSGGVPPVTLPKALNSDRPLSAPGRTLLKEFSTETSPTILPIGYSTVAFNERQIHTVVQVISDELVTTSMHVMKTMLDEAMRVGARS